LDQCLRFLRYLELVPTGTFGTVHPPHLSTIPYHL
jgi:hypothetical protein